MIGQGNSVSHGMVLKHYFINQADNDVEPEIFRIRGTATPNDYEKSIHEILFSGMLSKGDKSAYHLIINPSTKEDELSHDQWHTAIDEYMKTLGLEHQKHVAVKHVKQGRSHMHVLIDRYNYEQSKLISDGFNFYKHQTASTNLEEMFGHELTPRRTDYGKLSHHKGIITEIWHNTHDGESFLHTLAETGYHVGRGRGNHPLRVVPENAAKSKSLDLVRQLTGVKAKDVYERLEGIELQSEADALKKVSEDKKLSVSMVTDKFIDNLKDENFVTQPEDREKEKKRGTEPEAKIQPVADDIAEHLFSENAADLLKKLGASEDDIIEQMLRKKAQEQQRKRREKLREQQNDQGMSQ